MKNEKQLLTAKIGRLVWSFAIPSIVAMLINAIYNGVDRIYVSRIPETGSLAMTGIGLTAPLLTTVFAFLMLTVGGTALLISIKLGEKKFAEAQRIFNNAQELIILVMIAFSIITLLFLNPLMSFLGADAIVAPHATAYLGWMAIGFLVNGLGFFYANVLRSVGWPRLATLMMITGAITNIILDPIFIFVFNLGVSGAAMATIISQLISCVLGFCFIRRPSFPLSFRKLNFRFDYNLIAKIIKSGTPSFLIQIAQSITLIIINQRLLTYGTNDNVAAMTVVFTISHLVCFPLFGFLQGIQPIVGFNYGAKQYSRVRQVMRFSFRRIFIYALVMFSLVEIFPDAVMRIFTPDQNIIDAGKVTVRVLFAALPLVGVSILCSDYFQYTYQPRTAIFLSALRQVILQIPLLLILSTLFNHYGLSGVYGVYAAMLISDIVGSCTNMFIFQRKGMRKLPQEDGQINLDK